ncbi:MAG: AgmX/PglI C-terminal domain-containing protein [Deltaproteobacteria bacterium]|nr:AgmX/PglI C-terminal domain-containing protein [Deltaproteobacteria bacterium]
MKTATRWLTLLAVLVSIFSLTTAFSQPAESDDRTLSPYFFVKSDDPTVDRLPLKSTSTSVNISGVIADVRVTQVYRNEGKKPLEAIYVFPASTRAAVYGMRMTIGERVIEAKIKKRDEARRDYEQARDAGRSASLLEQQRPNVFQMNVANIMPGDNIKVEMNYTELLVPTDRVYEFTYPTVVGPRYSSQPVSTTSPAERWIENPYLHSGEAPPSTFDMTVTIAGGVPIRELACTSHKVNATYSGRSVAKISLDKSEAYGGNRDYILRYRLDGDRIQSGLLLYEGERENFFVLMMQPPKKVTNTNIPGREYIFIVDVSGSMYGFPLEISKKLMKNLVGNLRPTDRFNVLLFSGGSSLMSEESLPATPENIQKAIHLVERQRGGGGTEILPALTRALSLKKPENYARTIVIATDGYVTVEEEVFDLIRNNLNSANMFAFGIGTSVNRHIIEGMARVGMGEPFVIVKPEEAEAKANRFRSMIASPVLTQVKVAFNGFAAYDVEPLAIPDVLAERPVIVFGKWRGTPEGTITMRGISGNGNYSDTIHVANVTPLKNNAALQYLWARHRITLLSDYNKLRANDERIKEVTDLGLSYNLLTAYTSFVAVDTEIRNVDGKPTTVTQPLPLPQGVSDYAVGHTMAKHYGFAPMMAMKEARAEYKDEIRRGGYGMAHGGKVPVIALTVGDVTATKGLAKDEIVKVVEAHTNEIERCFAGSGLKEKLILKFVVNPDGTVSNVQALSSIFRDKTLRQCVTEQVKKWQFPSLKSGREVKVTVTLVPAS